MNEPPLEALVVYESFFGNTEKVARAVAGGLRLEQLAVTTKDVADAGSTEAEPDRYALLVVGAPTHAFALSRPSTRSQAVQQGGDTKDATSGLREWLTALPAQQDLRLAATFDTRAQKVSHFPMSAARSAAHLLRRRRFTLIGHPAGFAVLDTDGPLEPGQAELAVEWGRSIARETQACIAANRAEHARRR